MNRVTIEAMDDQGRAVSVELAIGPKKDTVEGWSGDSLRAVFQRGVLARWLASPYGELRSGEMAWDRTELGIAVRLGDEVPWWELSPRDLRRIWGHSSLSSSMG